MATPRMGQIPEHIWTAILTEASQGATAQQLVAVWAPTVQERFGCELTWEDVAHRIRREELKSLPEPPEYDHGKVMEILEEIWAGLTPEDWSSIPHDGAENHDHYLYGAPKKHL